MLYVSWGDRDLLNSPYTVIIKEADEMGAGAAAAGAQNASYQSASYSSQQHQTSQSKQGQSLLHVRSALSVQFRKCLFPCLELLQKLKNA